MSYEGDVVRVLQRVIATSTSSVDATGNAIPIDTSIPQITEGVSLISQAFTPISSSSSLSLTFSSGVFSALNGTVALFDGSADALSSRLVIQSTGSVTFSQAIVFHATLSSGSTSARTYSLRAGTSSGGGTLTFNSPTFGGVAIMRLVITEYE